MTARYLLSGDMWRFGSALPKADPRWTALPCAVEMVGRALFPAEWDGTEKEAILEIAEPFSGTLASKRTIKTNTLGDLLRSRQHRAHVATWMANNAEAAVRLRKAESRANADRVVRMRSSISWLFDQGRAGKVGAGLMMPWDGGSVEPQPTTFWNGLDDVSRAGRASAFFRTSVGGNTEAHILVSSADLQRAIASRGLSSREGPKRRGRPGKQVPVIAEFIARLQAGTVERRASDEARAIVAALRGANPPTPETIAEKYLRPYHPHVLWDATERVANAQTVVDMIRSDLRESGAD